jgi:hypothetical protein
MYYAVAPSRNTAEYAPQGLIGSIISGLAPTVGGLIGGAAGNQQIGSQLGGLAGQLGSLLPFEAAPTAYSGPIQPLSAAPQAYAPQGYAPQGLIGSLISGLAPTVGGLIGGVAGNQQIGSQLGGLAGQLGSLLPFEAAPTAFGVSPQAAILPGASQMVPFSVTTNPYIG